MIKTYDLALNTIEDKMVKRENIRLTDDERSMTGILFVYAHVYMN